MHFASISRCLLFLFDLLPGFIKGLFYPFKPIHDPVFRPSPIVFNFMLLKRGVVGFVSCHKVIIARWYTYHHHGLCADFDLKFLIFTKWFHEGCGSLSKLRGEKL
ncbi:uncharacterized protein [Spinacia oleracea]|uniref:Secreted protein n=1 Tax=Spinacia oleracea TaxID=3562 RepID=A0ABM3RVI9_SPIOL|nr:uncharacterized protein LOC110780512 [Spinacia oleracea]